MSSRAGSSSSGEAQQVLREQVTPSIEQPLDVELVGAGRLHDVGERAVERAQEHEPGVLLGDLPDVRVVLEARSPTRRPCSGSAAGTGASFVAAADGHGPAPATAPAQGRSGSGQTGLSRPWEITNATTSATTVMAPRSTAEHDQQALRAEPARARRAWDRSVRPSAGPPAAATAAPAAPAGIVGGVVGRTSCGAAVSPATALAAATPPATGRRARALGSARSETPHSPQKEWLGVCLPQLAQVMSAPMGISSDSWSRPRWMIRRSQTSATIGEDDERHQLDRAG